MKVSEAVVEQRQLQAAASVTRLAARGKSTPHTQTVVALPTEASLIYKTKQTCHQQP